MTPWQLVDAHTVGEAVAALHAHRPRAQPIAAGGDLLGLLKEGVQGAAWPPPAVLVNLATVPELRQVQWRDDALRLGSMLTLAELARLPGVPPMLAEAVGTIASPQLRHATTLGGNLLQRPRCLYFRHPDLACFKKGGTGCPAAPGPPRARPGLAGLAAPGRCRAGHASDLAPVLVALGAVAEIAGPGGQRMLPLAALYAGAADRAGAEADLAADELLVALTLPRRELAQAFVKAAPRAANEFAWAGVAVALAGDTQGRIVQAVVAASGIAPGPWVCEQAAGLLQGRHAAEVDARQLARRLVPPLDDSRSDAVGAALAAALARALAQLARRR